MNLTEHFTAAEFACRCQNPNCDKAGVKIALPQALEKLRAIIGKPIIVDSGYRCKLHPVEAAKPKPGQHNKGLAADIRVRDVTARALYAAARTIPEFRGFGVSDEQQYLHLDLRSGPTAHWCYSGGQEVPWYEAQVT